MESIDWNACIICNKCDGELKCPVDSHLNNGLEVYRNFLDTVQEFRSLDALPVNVTYEGDNVAELFYQKKAKWHKSCHLKFSASKLLRVEAQKKRKLECGSSKHYEQRKSKRHLPSSEECCIFCSLSSGKLHKCTTIELDHELRKMASDLQDTSLIAKLSAGDLIAIEAKYHYNCLSAFKSRHRSLTRSQQCNDNTEEKELLARAFAEVVSYIDNEVENDGHIFKLSQLHSLYEGHLQTLGVCKSINKTRFKRQLIDHFSGMCQEQSDGKNCLLVFNEGMKKVLKESTVAKDIEPVMANLVKTIRNEIFELDSFQFSGSFPPKCQENSVPPILKKFMCMLLNGPQVQHEDEQNSQACLTISQLVCFNVKSRKYSLEHNRHFKGRETPLPLYIGLNIHTQTRSRILLNQFHRLGISISYNRVIELENALASAMCTRFEDDGIVCPSHLRNGLFTVGALDNIDHNLSSTTAEGSFHGTAISVFQFPTVNNIGICRDPISISPETKLSEYSLLDSYTNVPAVTCKTSELALPQVEYHEFNGCLEQAQAEEMNWAESAAQLLAKDKLEDDDYVSWAAFHAATQSNPEDPIAVNALLPLFSEKSATIAMVKHGMECLKKITSFLNPNQTPVMVFDQPLFTLAKYVQWSWPQSLGEQSFVVMLGGLHIEMALWSTIGDFLDRSGWTTALCEAGIATAGVADSFLKVSHLTRTRRSHQITALVLSMLQQDAWKCAMDATSEQTEFEEWRQIMKSKYPTFQFWDLILEYEILVMIFVRAHRVKDFQLYIESLEALTPWFFALDHINYARWVPIHIRDMKSLPDAELAKCWVLRKTPSKFSFIPIDQGHEQNNEMVKGSGGAVGITENPTAFRRWMVAGPEQARLLAEFESQFTEDHISGKHHEQGLSAQELFKKHSNSLYKTMTNMGNPFKDDCAELLAVDSRNCANESVISTVNTIKAIGTAKYQKYVSDVITTRSVSIHQPIKKNSLPLWKRQSSKAATRTSQKLANLRSDCNLFSHLYIASKFRDGNLEDFFSHENHPWPPSISDNGKLRLPNKKSDLLVCLGGSTTMEATMTFHAKIFDGPSVVHTLSTKQASTFDQYGDEVFLPWTRQQLYNCERIDIVWDRYVIGSLKDATREKRGKGVRRKVQAHTKLPANFPDFLRDNTNKIELFEFLTQKVSKHDYPSGKQVYITSGESVICKGSDQPMQLCHQEEADTRLCVHVLDALEKGARNILVTTVDTDVVVLLASMYFQLSSTFSDLQIWVGFGTGNHFRYYDINSISQSLGEQASHALPFFHAFTGCDTTSQFLGKGKKSAWESWKAYPEATKAFLYAKEHPFQIIQLGTPEIEILERYVCVLYDKTTPLSSVNEARKELFCKRAKTMEAIPPTQCSLLQHTNRALYQASIWTTCLQLIEGVQPPEGFGWQRDEGSWTPVWTLLPEVAKASQNLIKCGCKVEPLCSRRCKCHEAGLPCTALCHCSGMCHTL